MPTSTSEMITTGRGSSQWAGSAATAAVEQREHETAILVPSPPPATSVGNSSQPESDVNQPDRIAVIPTTAIEVGEETTRSASPAKKQPAGGMDKRRNKKSDNNMNNNKMRDILCCLPHFVCHIFSLIYSFFRVIGILIQNLYHVPTYLFFNWIFFYPIYFFRPSLFNWIENWLYSVCIYTVGSWSWFANIQVIECGDDLYRIRHSPTGVVYGSNGNNNSPAPPPQSPNSSERRVPIGAAENQQHLSHKQQHLNHQNSVNHMMTEMSKGQQLCSSVNRVSALIQMPSPVIDDTNLPGDKCKGVNPLTSPASPLHAGRKLHRTSSMDSVNKSDGSSGGSRGRVLLMANHQSTSDVPLMFQALSSKAKYVLLWVMDFQFKYTHFGVISGTHGDYFITPKSFVKNELTKHCLSNPDKDLIILFPEGGFRYKRIESSKSYAQKRGWPILHHLTWPRTGAFLDLTEGALDITHIVDLTILYPDQEKTTSILDIVLGRNPQQIYFHYRIFELTSDGIYGELWLNERWMEKEALMKSFYESPDDFLQTKAGTLRPIQLSGVKLLFNNLLMMIGFCIVYVVIKFLVSVFI